MTESGLTIVDYFLEGIYEGFIYDGSELETKVKDQLETKVKDLVARMGSLLVGVLRRYTQKPKLFMQVCTECLAFRCSDLGFRV